MEAAIRSNEFCVDITSISDDDSTVTSLGVSSPASSANVENSAAAASMASSADISVSVELSSTDAATMSTFLLH